MSTLSWTLGPALGIYLYPLCMGAALLLRRGGLAGAARLSSLTEAIGPAS
jgi:hypothetical protein